MSSSHSCEEDAAKQTEVTAQQTEVTPQIPCVQCGRKYQASQLHWKWFDKPALGTGFATFCGPCWANRIREGLEPPPKAESPA